MPTPLPSRRRLLPLLALVIACGGEDRIQAPSLAADPAVMIALPGATFHPRRVRDGSVPQFSYCSGSCPTDSTMVDFEGGWAPGFTPVDSQYAALGVVFGNAVVGETTDSFYNDPEYPPRSGSALAAADFTSTGDWSGTLSLALDTSAVRVRGYITSFSPVTLQCFNVADSLLAESVFPGANLALLHGGPPNQPVEVSAAGIRRCQFLGPNAQYTLDDLTVVWVAPLPTLACDTVVRGAMGTCAVTGADSVLQWRFRGVLDSASRLVHTDSVVADTSLVPDTTWSGTAVLSGAVSALVRYGPLSDTLTLTAPWDVQPRTGSAWRWGHSNWRLDTLGTRMCPYPDLVVKLFGSTWRFPGDGRLAAIRRPSGCVGGSIEPNLVAFPDSGTTIGVGQGGPNDALYYVMDNTFTMHHVSEINDWLDAATSPVSQITTADSATYNACYYRMSAPPLYGTPLPKNIFTFNATCADTGVTTLVQGLIAHEQYGTKDSSSLSTANGHEARRRLAAINVANDPRSLVEPLVSMTTPGDLKTVVRRSVQAADVRISNIAIDHWYVNNNIAFGNPVDCLGVWMKWIPPAPAPSYYSLFPFRMLMPDSVTVGCP